MVVQGRKINQPGAVGREHFQVFGVIEAEGPIAGDTDTRPGIALGAFKGFFRCVSGDIIQGPDQAVDIEVVFDHTDQAIQLDRIQGMIVGGHKTQVAFRHVDLIITGQPAQAGHGHPVLEGIH